jgi:hypothetical protein
MRTPLPPPPIAGRCSGEEIAGTGNKGQVAPAPADPRRCRVQAVAKGEVGRCSAVWPTCCWILRCIVCAQVDQPPWRPRSSTRPSWRRVRIGGPRSCGRSVPGRAWPRSSLGRRAAAATLLCLQGTALGSSRCGAAQAPSQTVDDGRLYHDGPYKTQRPQWARAKERRSQTPAKESRPDRYFRLALRNGRNRALRGGPLARYTPSPAATTVTTPPTSG